MINGIVFSTNKIVNLILQQPKTLIFNAQSGTKTFRIYFHELLLSSFPSHKNFNYNPTKSILTTWFQFYQQHIIVTITTPNLNNIDRSDLHLYPITFTIFQLFIGSLDKIYIPTNHDFNKNLENMCICKKMMNLAFPGILIFTRSHFLSTYKKSRHIFMYIKPKHS
jgi:hypothetical protein